LTETISQILPLAVAAGLSPIPIVALVALLATPAGGDHEERRSHLVGLERTDAGLSEREQYLATGDALPCHL
jgi:hypothetical protein